MVDASTNGRISDGGVINNTKFYDLLKRDLLSIPQAEKTYNKSKEFALCIYR